MFYKCAIYSKHTHKVAGTPKRVGAPDEATLYSERFNKAISVNDVLCGRCRVYAYLPAVTENQSCRGCRGGVPACYTCRTWENPGEDCLDFDLGWPVIPRV